MVNYVVIGTSINGGDIYFSGKSYQFMFGAIGELCYIAAQKQTEGYELDLKLMEGLLLVTDKKYNLIETYKVYETELI